MKTFAEKINVLVQKGYLEDAARAKVAHDAVLMAMRKAGFGRPSGREPCGIFEVVIPKVLSGKMPHCLVIA